MAECTDGIPAQVIAERCRVDIATARRWKSGRSRIPSAAAALLLGELGMFSPAWRGWRIVDEEIVSPDGWRISRNDALAVPLLHAQLSALRSEVAQLKECTKLDEQPVPGEAADKIA
jgi:hypothetical protein